MKSLKLYWLSNCDGCRRAAKWLEAQGLAYETIPIREKPPTAAELRAVLAARGGELRRLFNVSGKEYREQGLAAKVPAMKDAEAITTLSANGNLVKRPVLIGEGVALNGFDAEEWASVLKVLSK